MLAVVMMLAATACQPAPPPTTRHNPVGSLDLVTVDQATATLSGWSADPDSAEFVAIHVYIDGKSRAATTANRSRPDVARVHPAHGPSRGYSVTVDGLSDGFHDFCTYAINIGAGTGNTRLGCRTVLIDTGVGGWTDSEVDTAPHLIVHVHASYAASFHKVAEGVAVLNRATGNNWTMGEIVDRSDPDAGELIISKGTMCGTTREAGCASRQRSWAPEGTRPVVTWGKITIAPKTIGTYYEPGVIMHELGHIAGLSHFEGPHLGIIQVMNPVASSPRINQYVYESGDLNGLRTLGRQGRDNPNADPSSTVFPASIGTVIETMP